MNNMENISSKEYAEAYFAEEEEMKIGTHPSQIIPRATEELKSRGYDVDNIIIWDWYDNNGTVKIKFSDGEVVSYDYINNQIINNRSENIISNYSKSKHEYLMDWVHGLYNAPLNIHISEYNKLHLDNNILRDDVIVVKGMVSLFMNAHYGSCLQYKHYDVDHEALSEKLKSYMLKYQQICNYLSEKSEKDNTNSLSSISIPKEYRSCRFCQKFEINVIEANDAHSPYLGTCLSLKLEILKHHDVCDRFSPNYSAITTHMLKS